MYYNYGKRGINKMAIFNFRKKAAKVKDENEATTTQPASDLSPQVDDVLLRAFLSNEPITREMAMTIPAVSSAVDLISSTIASMPVKLYRYKSGEVETDEEGKKSVGLEGSSQSREILA